MDTPREDRIQAAIERIARRMRSNGAPLLVDNLADGASPDRLAEAERELGFPLPPDLRALWSLHDGQREELNGFIEWMDLFGTELACAEHERVVMSVDFLRKDPGRWDEAGVTREEVCSDHWIPFAGRDSDFLVVSGVTGRVFSCRRDSPPLRLLAPSVADWVEQYAARVEADDYAVEEGFGDYYLEERDRERERREAELEEQEAAHERYRRATPLVDQMRDALARASAEMCQQVLKDAIDRKEPQTLEKCVALLVASTAAPTFVVNAIRPVMNALVLTPDQWVDVAIGGALLENNAVRGTAIARCVGVSTACLERLAADAAKGPAGSAERRAMEHVLHAIRPHAP